MTDFSNHTDDELADAGKAWMDEVEARVAALPIGALKVALTRDTDVLHGRLNRMKALLVAEERIQPFSGGDPKP